MSQAHGGERVRSHPGGPGRLPHGMPLIRRRRDLRAAAVPGPSGRGDAASIVTGARETGGSRPHRIDPAIPLTGAARSDLGPRNDEPDSSFSPV